MGEIIALMIFLPVLLGIFIIALGVAFVVDAVLSRYVGQRIAAALAFIAFTLAMIGCIWVFDQIRFIRL